MFSSVTQWFESQSFSQQIILLALVFDPIGFVGGYLFGPAYGVDPLIGGVYGLLAASIPTSIHVMNHARTSD